MAEVILPVAVKASALVAGVPEMPPSKVVVPVFAKVSVAARYVFPAVLQDRPPETSCFGPIPVSFFTRYVHPDRLCHARAARPLLRERCVAKEELACSPTVMASTASLLTPPPLQRRMPAKIVGRLAMANVPAGWP
jgi:hypothetical protein